MISAISIFPTNVVCIMLDRTLQTAKRTTFMRSKKKEENLKRTASMKVKAGERLPTAEARVGELYSIPLYEHI